MWRPRVALRFRRIVEPFSARLEGVLIATGILLRVRQYLFNRSLWLDEALLTSSILRRPVVGLWRPLEFNQHAPLGFLLVEKASVEILGPGELVLRLFPLGAGIISLLLFGAVARRCLERNGARIALLLFAVSAPLVYYASEVKQYSSDVAIALGLSLLGLRAREGGMTGGGVALLATAGAIAVWFSHPAVFVLAGCGAVLLAAAHSWPARARILAAGAVWLASFGLGWIVTLRQTASKPDLQWHWAGAFFPFPPASLKETVWIPRALLNLFSDASGLTFAAVGIAVSLLGLLSAFRRRSIPFAILLSPFVLALIASALHRYPFVGRFLLFLVPSVFLSVALGLEQLRAATQRLPAAALLVGTLLVLLPLGRAGYVAVRPRTHQEIRWVLEDVRSRIAPGDLLYDYRYSPMIDYYVPRLGLQGWERVRAPNARKQRQDYERDLASLRGRGRVWFIFPTVQGESAEDVSFFRSVLDRFGSRLDAIEKPGAGAYLYDLGPPAARGRVELLGSIELSAPDVVRRDKLGLSPELPRWFFRNVRIF